MKNRRPFGGQDTFPRQSIDHPEPLAGTGPVPESRRFSVRECPNSSRPLTSAPYPAYSMSWSRRRGSGVAPVGISRRSCAGHRDRSAVRGRAYRHKVAESARPPPRNSMEPVRDVAQPSRALFSYAAFAAFAVLVTRCAIETVPIRGAIAIGDGASAQHPRPHARKSDFPVVRHSDLHLMTSRSRSHEEYAALRCVTGRSLRRSFDHLHFPPTTSDVRAAWRHLAPKAADSS
jgi:hypothetical protein